MPELVSQQTLHFELSIWCNNVATSQTHLQHTLSSRGVQTPKSTVHFNPPVFIKNIENKKRCDALQLDSPVFFENKNYDVEFVFPKHLISQFGDSTPVIHHRLRAIEDSFRFNPKTGSLRATVNTGNDVGWFSMELVYLVEKKVISQSLAFEVLPLKMDLNADIESINRDIDKEFPLWRFSLAQRTHQNLKADRTKRQSFLLLWLAQFEMLWYDLENGLKHVLNAPHSKLLNYSRSVRLERLNGKLGSGLQAQAREAIASGNLNKHFVVKKKHLSLDTLENKFIKFVITNSIEKLSKIVMLAEGNNHLPKNQRLSDSFFEGLIAKRTALTKISNQKLFKEVGTFSGLTAESLVLQQKPGYAKVYKAWQQLKWFLQMLGNNTSLSARNMAELYEVWCFLQVRTILTELGFKEVLNRKPTLINHGLEVAMKDGIAGAFHFQRDDGISVRLAHERVFRETTKPIRTWMTTQKPDIFLNVKFPDNSEISWIFDAKYRVNIGDEQDDDLAPDDAINQMHRYRDALIYQEDVDQTDFARSRPVFGAYVLYPGFYDQANQSNPYQEAIDEIGIGAFSLLPSNNNNGNYWLRNFLKSKLGADVQPYQKATSEKFFVENAVRIANRGTKVTHYDGLTAIFTGRVLGRTQEYLDRMRTGTLDAYHTRLLATDRQEIGKHIVKELRYICVARPGDGEEESIDTIYPINSVKLVKRGSLDIRQTGTDVIKDPNQDYWYFELGSAIKLPNVLTHTVPAHFRVLLTNYESITRSTEWHELPELYSQVNHEKH